jgi:hypothetical protein
VGEHAGDLVPADRDRVPADDEIERRVGERQVGILGDLHDDPPSGHPSVAISTGGGVEMPASTSPPPVCTSNARVAAAIRSLISRE